MKLGSNINGFAVHHDGNHDNRGNPHNQYISKHHFGKTVNIGETTGQYLPLATIRYEQDNNYMLKYGFDFIMRPMNDRHTIDMLLNVSGVSELRFTRDGTFSIFATYKNLGPVKDGSTKDIGEVTLYVQFYNAYRQGFIQLNHALVYNPQESSFTMQDDEAFHSCVVHNRATPATITPNVTAKGVRKPQFGSRSQTEQSIASGQGYDIKISGQTLEYGCVVSVSFNAEFSRSLVVSAPTYNVETREIIIKVRNVSEFAYSIPACTISWAIHYQ